MSAALAAATVVLGVAGTVPARAEFFGCNDRPGQVLYDSSWHTNNRYARYVHDYSAQPRRYDHVRVTSYGSRRYNSSRHYR
jgi:hypothetical protein